MSRDDVRRYLVTYDVAQDRRRTRLAKELEHYGDRIQYSVFLFDISPAAMLRLKTEILDLVDVGEDSVLICDLGLKSEVSDKNFQYLGVERPITDDSVMIF